jgi:acyl-CoA dehydrogenase
LASEPILLGGTEEQKDRWLKPMAAGEKIGACCITEPGAGSDVSAIRSRAKKVNGGYLLEGNKIFITNGSVADTYVVVARIEGHDRNQLTMFLVDKNQEGISFGKKEKKMGIRGSVTSEVIFDNCFVPEDCVIGKNGEGFKILMKTFNSTRPAVGAQALGISKGAFRLALDYVRERKQFGKAILENQGIQWMLAEMILNIKASEALVYKAGYYLDNYPQHHEIPAISSMAKWFASDVAMKIAVDAVQLFGGYGYIKEYQIERMMRDAKILQIYEGTNQIQRNVVFRQLIKRM